MYAGEATSRPIPPDPFTRSGIAANEVEDLVKRIEELASKLVGPEPEGAADLTSGLESGLLGRLGNVAEVVISATSRGRRAINRIEGLLP